MACQKVFARFIAVGCDREASLPA